MNGWRIKTARGTLDLRQFGATLAYFVGMLRGHVGVLTLAFLANLLTIALTLASPWPVKVVLDHVILDHKPPAKLRSVVKFIEHRIDGKTGASNENRGDTGSNALPTSGQHGMTEGRRALLLLSCAAVVAIAVMIGLTDYVSQLLLANTAHKVGNDLRRRLFKHMQMLSISFHERSRTGDLLLRLTGDVSMVRDMLVESIFDLAEACLLTLGYLFVMFTIAPRLAWISVMAIPLVIVVSMLMSMKLRSAVKKAREKEGDLISVAGEVLAGISLVQAFTREQDEKERFSRLGRSSLRAGLKTVRLESKLARTVQIITAVGTCGILYYGVGEVTAGVLTPGTLVVFMSYFNGLLKPVRAMSKITSRMAKSSSCAERIRDVLQTRPEIEDSPTARAAPAFEGRITYDQVNFSYRAGGRVLNDIQLDILPGQRVALVGPTGAGKSTLVKLLLRFSDPSTGAVRIDGHDLRELTLESLRRQISVVQQETILFGTTIAENIAMGRSGATIDDVRQAAAAIGIDQWLSSLPGGYDTRVGERGVTLSGGQRQLIALARAALRNGRILIFDEPTTGLDAQTEARFRFALRRTMQDRTTIIISHRPRPLADVDRIVVVEDGRIVQDCPACEVRSGPGPFQDLFADARPELLQPEAIWRAR